MTTTDILSILNIHVISTTRTVLDGQDREVGVEVIVGPGIVADEAGMSAGVEAEVMADPETVVGRVEAEAEIVVDLRARGGMVEEGVAGLRRIITNGVPHKLFVR